MSWTIRGYEYGNCNCAWGCPCQFNSPSTYGFCEAVTAGHIEEGSFDGTSLDGLNFILLLQWPGEIADGNGKEQVIVDERADAAQRQAIEKIALGEDTSPGATHYFVYNSTMSEVLETLYAPITFEFDLKARTARVEVPGLVQSTGRPITDPNSGQEFHAAIQLPNGFEYTTAEMGSGSSQVSAGISLDLTDSYGQFNTLHMNQDGVIR
jgi:hypothetical protein